MYLFDTDAITNIFKPRPSPRLVERLSQLDVTDQYVSVITISEIVYGAFKSDSSDRHMRNLKEILLPNVNVVDYDLSAAYATGRIRAELERIGQSVPFVDLQIASIAMVHGFCLVTGNTRHFERIPGLRIENWLRG